MLAAAGAVLLVTGLVAVAAGEDIPPGSARRPGDRALDLLFSFVLVALALALIGGAVLYVLGWHMKLREGASRSPSSPWRGLVFLALGTLPLVLIALRRSGHLRFGGDGSTGDLVQPPGSATSPAAPGSYEPEFATAPVLIALGAALATALALWFAHRARQRAGPGRASSEPPPSLDDVLAETVDDLRAEPDPRRAVIAAYARLERALAAAGHPRLRSDAPHEYLGRVLHEAEVSPRSPSLDDALRTREVLSTRRRRRHENRGDRGPGRGTRGSARGGAGASGARARRDPGAPAPAAACENRPLRPLPICPPHGV